MPRLALCYGAAALIALTVPHRRIPHLIAALLVGYALLLLLGRGFAYDETNILSVVDRAVLGPDHMYKDNGIEPEGLLSTVPAVAHVLIGFCCGALLLGAPDVRDKMLRLFLLGTAMALSGWLLSYGCPINKKVWSPTFVLTTCGMASSLLALLVWIIDVRGRHRWCRFFESFGVSPLFMYVLAAICSILLGNIRVSHSGGESISLGGWLYGAVLRPLLGDYPGSLAYALLLVSACWCIGYILYRRNIYIKI